MDLKNKKVTVVGARRSGVAVANLVTRLNGIPKISDNASRETSEKDLQKLISPERIAMEWGGHTRSFIEDSDLIVLSPGVPINAPPVEWAKAKNIPVWGEIELASRFCLKPIIAVTGSNGKTTVVNLITRVLEKAGKKVCLCGNVGMPFSGYVLDLQDKDYVVLEISSFQLESIVSFHPYVAVLLNFSQNHLDRHKDLQEYFDAKARIFMNQTSDDYAVLNYQSKPMEALAATLKANVVYFNSPQVLQNTTVTNPNHLAAMIVGKILGVPEKTSQQVFDEFKGVEHRLELVRSINGVNFINDSKATTAEAARWALQNFSKPIVMICGGRDKNIDFTVLRDLVKAKVKMMIAIGEAREKLKKSFADVVAFKECQTLEEAVKTAKQCAQSGESVVLSPMCTSFDMFANFEERGKVFKDIVNKL